MFYGACLGKCKNKEDEMIFTFVLLEKILIVQCNTLPKQVKKRVADVLKIGGTEKTGVVTKEVFVFLHKNDYDAHEFDTNEERDEACIVLLERMKKKKHAWVLLRKEDCFVAASNDQGVTSKSVMEYARSKKKVIGLII